MNGHSILQIFKGQLQMIVKIKEGNISCLFQKFLNQQNKGHTKIILTECLYYIHKSRNPWVRNCQRSSFL